jgi:hypothetical protein
MDKTATPYLTMAGLDAARVSDCGAKAVSHAHEIAGQSCPHSTQYVTLQLDRRGGDSNLRCSLPFGKCHKFALTHVVKL